jgi:hypothetical protein
MSKAKKRQVRMTKKKTSSAAPAAAPFIKADLTPPPVAPKAIPKGLAEYPVPNSPYKLLGPIPDTKEAAAKMTIEQRVAIAERLLEIGPKLPRHIDKNAALVYEEERAKREAINKAHAAERIAAMKARLGQQEPKEKRPPKPSLKDATVTLAKGTTKIMAGSLREQVLKALKKAKGHGLKMTELDTMFKKSMKGVVGKLKEVGHVEVKFS